MVSYYNLWYILKIPLGLRKFAKDGHRGGKIHFSAYDREVLEWKLGSLLAVEYDDEQGVLIIRNIKLKSKG
jgi:hypothetical protein